MAERLGLDPLEVTSALARIHGPLEHADRIAAELERAWWASIDPSVAMIGPPGLLLAAVAVESSRRAAADVRNATALASALIETIRVEVDAQVGASSSTGDSYRIGAAHTARWLPTVSEVARDPALLLGLGVASRAAFLAAAPDALATALAIGSPGIVGGIEGAPYRLRDAANRRRLDEILGDLGSAGARTDAAEALRDAIRSLEVRGLRVELVSLDLAANDAGGMRAAIGLGRLDDAGAVTVLVPGMGTTVAESARDLSADAVHLLADEQLLAPSAGVAVVAWLGYESPDVLTVGGEAHAVRGAERFSAFLEGIDAANAGARVTIVAHSYGGRVATYALATGAHADALVLLGTPGVAESVSASAALDAGEVFATKSDADQRAFDLVHWDRGIASLGQWVSGLDGRENADPTDPAFGAVVYRVEDPDGHGLSYPDASKQGYLSAGSDSLRDISLIALGRGAELR